METKHMKTKSMGLSWIVVSDLKQAIKFYTEVVGLELKQYTEEYGWAELEGHDGGARLGIAQENPEYGSKAGVNAVVTMSVDNIEEAVKELSEQGVTLVGDIIEIAGHIKMQSVEDVDGNHFQVVQKLD